VASFIRDDGKLHAQRTQYGMTLAMTVHSGHCEEHRAQRAFARRDEPSHLPSFSLSKKMDCFHPLSRVSQ
jgi:hypothetical protein